jgi:hypothetical protein
MTANGGSGGGGRGNPGPGLTLCRGPGTARHLVARGEVGRMANASLNAVESSGPGTARG